MTQQTISILLVEDNPGDAGLVRGALRPTRGIDFQLTHEQKLADATLALRKQDFDVVLLDLFLPDSQGLDTLKQTLIEAPDTPVVVFTGLEDETVGIEAVRHGAQDYLIKGRAGSRLVSRAVCYAVERQRVERELKAFAETLEQRVAERSAVAEQQAFELRALASELTEAEQIERRRLADQLHDGVQRSLVQIKNRLDQLHRETGDGQSRQLAEQIAQMVQQAVDATRSLSYELSPPVLYEEGLEMAIRWLGQWIGERHGLHVEVTADLEIEPSDQTKVVLFQAVRELLFDIVRSGRDGEAALSLHASSPTQISVCLQESAAGMQSDSATESLRSVHRRIRLLGGEMQVDQGEVGRQVSLVMPLHPEETSADVSGAKDDCEAAPPKKKDDSRAPVGNERQP